MPPSSIQNQHIQTSRCLRISAAASVVDDCCTATCASAFVPLVRPVPSDSGRGANAHRSLDAMEDEGRGSRAGGQPRVEKSKKLVIEEGARTVAEKSKYSSIGGKITAAHRKMTQTGERPRFIGHAIRGDLKDAVDQFISQVCVHVHQGTVRGPTLVWQPH